MKNKMATLLGNTFSTNEKVMSQCDDQTLGSIVEMLVIQFPQEKFEQLQTMGNTSTLCVRKLRKVFLATAPLASSWKQASGKANKALSKPTAASGEA